MHNPESVLENEMQNLLRDFEIQTDNQMSDRRPDLLMTNKKKRSCQTENFVVPVDNGIKLKQNDKRWQPNLDLAKELEKL